MNFRFEEGEIILIDKPYRWTSFDVVNNFRSFLKTHCGIKKIKIGHAGTLDPLATGLLILCTGKFTKRIEEFKEYDKEYTGTFMMGASTPSYDLETGVDKTSDITHLTEILIREAVASFTGDSMQVPPVFSAVKIGGKRAYEFARNELPVRLNPKPITITGFEVTNIRLPEIGFRIACSKGTYIRAIARDLGEKLQTEAYLSALCRTRVGPYHLRDAYQLEELKSLLKNAP
jgi:tRNA pseudouridine55 synthase